MDIKKNIKKTEKHGEEFLFKLGNVTLNKNKLFAFGSFVIAIFYLIISDNEKKGKFFKLISNKKFTFSMFFVIVFSFVTLYFTPKNKDGIKVTKATKQAIIGLLIGIFHHLGFTVGPFWFIWLVSYYLDLSE